MNLKEAFRYQNKLHLLLEETQRILGCEKNVMKVENTYLRRKVMQEAENETVEDMPATEYADRITELAGFMMFVLEEKEKLFRAIRDAKSSSKLDIDSETSLNAARQSSARVLMNMADLRSSEVTIANGGYGYRFNSDGNQVSYKCDVKRVTTINFDRNVVRRELAKLNRIADETSAKLDLCMVTSQVDYQPPFDVNDSFGEAFEAWTEKAGA